MSTLRKSWPLAAALTLGGCAISLPQARVNYAEAAFQTPSGDIIYTPGMSCPAQDHANCDGVSVRFNSAGAILENKSGRQRYPGGGDAIETHCHPVAVANQGLGYGRYSTEYCQTRIITLNAQGIRIPVPQLVRVALTPRVQ
jgi:hypothetical protein